MKKFLFWLVQFTWALPQNIVGLIGFLILHRNHKWERFHNAFITYVEAENFGGVSLGIFIFINPKRKGDWLHDTRIHEYGHTIQSLALGPVWFLVIAIPSFIWCNLPAFVKMRKEGGVSYYKAYCEGWANLWGRAWARESFISRDMLDNGFFGKPIKPAKFEKTANK